MITGKIIEKLPASLKKKIENNMELRNIIGNVNWLTFENIFKSIIGMFVYGAVAKYLGPEKFGVLNYSLTFVSLFAFFSALGMDDIVIRNFLSKPKEKGKYFGTVLLLKFIGSLIMILLSTGVAFFLEKDNPSVKFFVFILAFGYIFNSFNVIDLWFKSQVKSQFSVYARSLSFIIISVLKVVFIVTKAPLIAFISMYSLDFLLTAIFLIIFYKKQNKGNNFIWKVDKDVAKEVLKSSLPLFLAVVTLSVETQIDQILLKRMVSAENLGIYSAALKIIVSFSFLSSVLRSSFLPSIIKAKNISQELYMKKLQQLYQTMMWAFVLVAIPTILFSKQIVSVLYGKEYLEAAKILPLMTLRLYFNNYNDARTVYLLNEKLLKFYFISTLIGTISNVLLNMYLIPKYQSLGVIISFVGSFFISMFLVDLIYPKTRKNALLMAKSSFNFYKLIFS